jgi:arsenite methyltransferase
MNTKSIENRYSQLAEDTCCLSCGGALDFSTPQKDEICLDLGSGRGNDVIRLAEKVGHDGFAYGLDITTDMIKKAERTAEKLGVSNVKFLQSPLEKIPLHDQSVDLVISNCTINHAEDKEKVWSEIYRVLKNGGRFVVSDIYAYEKVPEEYASDPEAIAECWAGAIQREEYIHILQEIGFREIEIIEESDFYKKGKIEVASFTVKGYKRNTCCACSNN